MMRARVAFAGRTGPGVVVTSAAALFMLWVFPSTARADKDCADFANQADAQHYFEANEGSSSNNFDLLDADGDGIACEGNPCPCDKATGGGGGSPSPPLSGTKRRFRAVLDHVVDGDTLRVFIGHRHPYVRLIGIDTPEVFGGRECGGPPASRAMKHRIKPGEKLRLVTDPTQDRFDRYGRLLAYAIKQVNGLDLGILISRFSGSVSTSAIKPRRRMSVAVYGACAAASRADDMTSLSGSFQTDLSPVDALAASADAIDGLGWQIESVGANRIVSHADSGSGPPPKIEVVVEPSGTGTDVLIRGSDAGGNPLSRDELVALLDQARDAIRVSIENATPEAAWSETDEPAQSDVASGPEVQAPGRVESGSRRGSGLIVWGLVLAAVSFFLPVIFVWIPAIVIGLILLGQRRWKWGVIVVILGLLLPAAGHEWFMTAYEMPSGSMEPTLEIGQRIFVNRAVYHFTDPKIGDIVVFHPPAGAERGSECGVPRDPEEACPRPTPEKDDQKFVKRIVAGRATGSRSATVIRSSTERWPRRTSPFHARAEARAICPNRSPFQPATTS